MIAFFKAPLLNWIVAWAVETIGLSPWHWTRWLCRDAGVMGQGALKPTGWMLAGLVTAWRDRGLCWRQRSTQQPGISLKVLRVLSVRLKTVTLPHYGILLKQGTRWLSGRWMTRTSPSCWEELMILGWFAVIWAEGLFSGRTAELVVCICSLAMCFK